MSRTLTIYQKKAIRRLRFWLSEDGPFLLLDSETTGLKKWDEVVELVIVDWLTGNVLFSSRVKPTQPISPEATAIHGITDDDVKDALSIVSLYPLIAQVFGLWPDHAVAYHERTVRPGIFAWNAAFDERMLIQSMQAHGLRDWTRDYPALMLHNWMDAQELYNLWCAEPNPNRHLLGRHGQPWKYQSLERACAEFGIETPGPAHRATSDTLAMREVLLRMLEIGEREGVSDEDIEEQLL